MSLLDQVLGGLMGGGNASASSPLANVLMSMLSGRQRGFGGQDQYASPQPGYGQGLPQGGGLGGLLSAFQQAGLGQIAQSWVGTGANQPVTPQQLQNVFGEEQVQQYARQAGMAPQDFLSQVSQHLPQVVDRMTPNGRLPDDGTVSV